MSRLLGVIGTGLLATTLATACGGTPTGDTLDLAQGSAQGQPDSGASSEPNDAAQASLDGGSTPDDAATAPKGDMAIEAGAIARPSYNKGTGFFVLNGELYDPKGFAFRIRGVNRNHPYFTGQPGISHSNANTVRTFMTDVASNLAYTKSDYVDYKEFSILTMSSFPTGGLSSCNMSASNFETGVQSWVDNVKSYQTLEHYMAINLANEWGPSNSTVWRDEYKKAIVDLRNAGYTMPLVIDSGGCGQDINDLVTYSADVFNADPQKNVIFSFHLYGGTSPTEMPTYFKELAALGKSAGMVFIIGEFGPGENLAPSPTPITPLEVIQAAETAGLGWMPWAWDSGYHLVVNTQTGQYNDTADLTADFGKPCIEDPTYGLKVLAKAPSW